MAKLSDDDVRAALRDLPDWQYAGGTLNRRITFPTFPAAIAFVNRVADLAELAGHHPDITINYATIGLSLSTHDAGGVTEKDMDLARRISALVEQ